MVVSIHPFPSLYLKLDTLWPFPVRSCLRTWLSSTEQLGWSVTQCDLSSQKLGESMEGFKWDLWEWLELFYITFFFLPLQKYLVPVFYVLFSHRKWYIREITAQIVTAYNAKHLTHNECLNTNTKELSEDRKPWAISKCSGITWALLPSL